MLSQNWKRLFFGQTLLSQGINVLEHVYIAEINARYGRHSALIVSRKYLSRISDIRNLPCSSLKSKAAQINICAAFFIGVLRKERRHEKNISRRLESLTGVGKAGTVPQNVVVLLSENIKKTFLFRIYSLWTEGHQEPYQAGLPWINRVNFNNFKRI